MARKAKKDQGAEVNPEVEEQLAVEEEQPAEAFVEEAGPSCGAALRDFREEQGFTTNDIAKQLRLSNTQIEALEQNDFAALPEATIVKGFIRNYAKFLDVPAEPLLADYAAMAPEKTDYSFTLDPGINMKITDEEKPGKLSYLLLGTGLLLALAIWFFYQNYIQKPSPVDPMPAIVESLPELALPISERAEEAAPAETVASNEAGEAATDKTELTLDKQVPEEEVKKPQAETVAAEMPKEEAPEAAPVAEADDVNEEQKPQAEADVAASDEAALPSGDPAPGVTRLEFNATQETWLSVVNTSGREVYNKILYAGNRDVIDVRNPKEITVGNAHGATLQINGSPIDLAPYTRINVARVRMNRLP